MGDLPPVRTERVKIPKFHPTDVVKWFHWHLLSTGFEVNMIYTINRVSYQSTTSNSVLYMYFEGTLDGVKYWISTH